MLKLKITWPLALLILLAVLVWLLRSSQPVQPQPAPRKARTPRPVPRRRHYRSDPDPVIITQRGDGPDSLSYADAVFDATLSREQLAAIAARENRDAVTAGFTFERPSVRMPSWRTP